MVADFSHAHPGGPEDGRNGGRDGGREIGSDDERWQRMWSHREQLLKVARRRSMSLDDAEDAVHEAMVRGMENPHVDDARLGAWLTTVTMRLCVDRYRQVNRDAEVRTRFTSAVPEPVTVEEAVCDRAEARWLTVRSGELPARQAEALRLKADDLDVGQVARHMGLSYEAVESLLARARRTLRNSLAGTLGAAGWLWARRPRTGGGSTQAVTMASAAATIAVLGFTLPYPGEPAPAREPGASAPETIGESVTVGSEAAPSPTAPASDGRPGGAAPEPSASATPLTGLVPLLLGVPLPPLPVLTAVPAPQLPPLPGTPRIQDVREVPDLSDLSDVPDVAVPDVPVFPDVPGALVAPSVPELPALPSAPPTGVPLP